MSTRPKLPPRKPDSERSHFVFLSKCGCPFGLVERTDRWCRDEDGAWDAMYDTRAEERAARAKGVTLVHVSHAEYTATYYDRMTARCPHGGAS